MVLAIESLGSVDIRIDDSSKMARKGVKRALLLVYLAESGGAHPRNEVARLLWPEADEALALSNFRSLLKRMRTEGFAPYLRYDRSHIALDPDAPLRYDVGELRNYVSVAVGNEVSALRAAAELVRGAFLQDVDLGPYPFLSEWAHAIQSELDVLMARTYTRLTARLLEQNDVAAALCYAQDMMRLAPYDQSANALYIRVLLADDQIARAMLHLAALRRELADEFEESLSPELEALDRQLQDPTNRSRLPIDAGLLTPEVRRSAPSSRGLPDPRAPLPYAVRGMVGSEDERALFTDLLGGGNRLISVVGIGGVGKTFFVRTQLRTLEARYGPDLYYVSLGSIKGGDGDVAQRLLAAILDALPLIPVTDRPLRDQVVDFLAARPSCLILDNFETVQQAALKLLELLQAIPQLTIILGNTFLLHEDELPQALYLHIMRVAAVCPAMYFIVRPMAQERLAGQGIAITAGEKERLAATDPEDTLRLVQQVARHLPALQRIVG